MAGNGKEILSEYDFVVHNQCKFCSDGDCQRGEIGGSPFFKCSEGIWWPSHPLKDKGLFVNSLSVQKTPPLAWTKRNR